MNQLESFLRESSILDRAPQALEQLESFVELLVTQGRGANLIGPLSREAIVSDLIIDSLLPVTLMPHFDRAMDVGSGAGLPGIPLAIAQPGAKLTLVEPRERRTTFLKLAVQHLALESVEVRRARVDKLGPELGLFDVMAAKAFRRPLEWLAIAQPWLTADGVVFVYASTTSWSDTDTAEAQKLGFAEVGRVVHPSRCERFAVVLRRQQ